MARVSKAEDNARARELVNDLRMQGLSYKEIGRRVGRDSSLISQIAHGKPKGASLVDALQKVERGEKSVDVARRTTKAGTQAKVRKGVGTIPGTDNISVKTKKGNKTIIKGLGQVSGKDKFAKWNVRFSRIKTISDRIVAGGVVPGRLPAGWTTDTLRERIANPQAGDGWKAGDARAALALIALEQQRAKITSVGAIQDVHVFTMD